MKKKQRTINLLLIGPLPPPIGGSTISFNYLFHELSHRKKFDVKLVNTAKMTFETINKSLFSLMQIVKICILISKSDVVSFHASTERFVYLGSLLHAFCRILRKPIQVRVFGSTIKEAYESARLLKKILFLYMLNSNQVLLQTKGLISYFEKEVKGGNKIHWFPTSRPIPPELPTPSKGNIKFRFIYAGHIIPEKGIKILLEAIKTINFSNGNYEIDLFGGKPNKSLIEEINKTPNINYKGEIKNEQLLTIMPAYNMMIFPSFYKGEGYPGAIIEALTCGVPVIATEWKYIPELIHHNNNGILVNPKSADHIVTAILKVINESDFYQQLKDNTLKERFFFDSKKWNGNVFETLVSSLVRE